MFKRRIKNKFSKCNTIQDYFNIRKDLKNYGVGVFYWEMENLKIFKNGYIDPQNNPFAQIIIGIRKDPYIDYGEFIMLNSIEHVNHKLLIPKTMKWTSFNILTLEKNDIPMLNKMKDIALSFVKMNKYNNFLLCFHCYPFNTVNSLHLHIVDLDIEPDFVKATNNISIDDVLECLTKYDN